MELVPAISGATLVRLTAADPTPGCDGCTPVRACNRHNLRSALRTLEVLDVLGRHALPADAPVAAAHLFECHERDRAQGLTFDADHRLGELRDHLLLLVRREHTLDQLHLHERHSASFRFGPGRSGCADPAPVSLQDRVGAPANDGPSAVQAPGGKLQVVDFRVLGSVGISDGDQPLPIGGVQARRLLGALLAHRNAVIAADRLVDILWPGANGSSPATLQSYVSKLRRFVEMAGPGVQLVNRAPGYVLELPDDLLDAARFERHLGEAIARLDDDTARALAAAESALDEWRGAAFAEFAEDEWARPVAVRLEELRVTAEEVRAEAELRLGRHGDALIGRLEALVVIHPLRERFWMQLMLGLYRCGRQPEALRYAQEYRKRMRAELGLDPSPALRDLEAAILGDDEALAWIAPAPGRSQPDREPRHRAGAMPNDATTLIGRDRDLEIAANLFDSGRVLTLFGPGGVGKTRLAYRLATRKAGHFADGTRLVELAPLRDPVAVVAAVADALDVQQRPNRSLEDSIVEFLADRSMLLVVDNCEHVLDSASDLVDVLVKWCPSLHVLATSREPLAIPGEVVWSVPPLPVPVRIEEPAALEASPAVQLFLDRARAAHPDFKVDDATLPDIAQICIRLDGLPLAIELAAARMRSMNPRQLAERLPDRFRLLAGARRATDPRHRTLRDLVKWSYELLTLEEQRLFEYVSLFTGWFDLELAERACAAHGIDRVEVAGNLAALIDKSMLVARDDGGTNRYRVLETLREFGRANLDTRADAKEVRAEHIALHVELAEAAAAGLYGPDERRWGHELDNAFDDLREAHAAALSAGDVDRALRLVVALREDSWRRIRYELLTWTEATVAHPDAAAHPLYPAALGIVAYGRFVRGELEAAVSIGNDAVRLAAALGSSTLGNAERAIGNAEFYRDNVTDAIAATERMLEIAGDARAPGMVAHACYMLSVAESSVGNNERGAALAQRATEAAECSGSPTAYAHAAYVRGLALEKTDPARALEFLDESLRQASTVDNRWVRAFALTESLWIRSREGDPLAALRGYGAVIDTWFRGGDWANQRLSLRNVFAIFEAVGATTTAATLFGALDAAGVMRAVPLGPGNAELFAAAAERVEAHLGREVFDERQTRGRAMRDEEVVRYVLAEIDRIAGDEPSGPENR